MLILDNGLIIIPGPKSTDNGKQRLIALAWSRPLAELASEHRFLPYEDVAAVTVLKEVPIKVEVVLHGGQTVTLQESWSGDNLGRKDRDLLVAGLASRLPSADAKAESTWSK